MHIVAVPYEYEVSRYHALEHSDNLEPFENRNQAHLVSPLSDFRVRGLPPTRVVMDLVAERLTRLETMWQLGDLSEHYRQFILANCEPFGIEIALQSAHPKRQRQIVIPTLALFLRTTEALEEKLGKLFAANCELVGCNLDPYKLSEEHLMRVYA